MASIGTPPSITDGLFGLVPISINLRKGCCARGMLKRLRCVQVPVRVKVKPLAFYWASVLGNWIFIFRGLAVFVDPVCNGLLQRSVPCCLRRNWHGLATDIPLVASLTGYVTSETPLFFRSEAH